MTTKAQEAAEEVRSATITRVQSMREALDNTKTRAAERVRKLSGTVRRIGEHMRIEEQAYIADHANDASERLDSVAEYIEHAEPGTLLQDAQDMARRRSGLIIGSTFVIGFLAGRFLKPPMQAGGTEESNLARQENASGAPDLMRAEQPPPQDRPSEARRESDLGTRTVGARS